VKTIFRATNVPVEFEEFNVSGDLRDQDNERKMKAAIDSLKRNRFGLKGIDSSYDNNFNNNLLNMLLFVFFPFFKVPSTYLYCDY
jgi:hypothetical protein